MKPSLVVNKLTFSWKESFSDPRLDVYTAPCGNLFIQLRNENGTWCADSSFRYAAGFSTPEGALEALHTKLQADIDLLVGKKAVEGDSLIAGLLFEMVSSTTVYRVFRRECEGLVIGVSQSEQGWKASSRGFCTSNYPSAEAALGALRNLMRGRFTEVSCLAPEILAEVFGDVGT